MNSQRADDSVATFVVEDAAASGVYAPLSEMLAAPFRATVIRRLPDRHPVTVYARRTAS